MVEEVRQQLFNLQDIKYQHFQQQLCPNVKNIIGVRIPNVRLLVKKLLKEDYIAYLDKLESKYYEEIMIEGMLIAKMNVPFNNKEKRLKKFITKIDNWAVCDTVASTFKPKKDEYKIIWNFITKYKNSKNEFELRFMIVMMLDYYLIDEYIDKVLEIIDSISVDYYYTNMAIAWLISMLYVKDKNKTLKYLKDTNLSSFTYQKALQKIIESNRVSFSEKEIIRKMKQK